MWPADLRPDRRVNKNLYSVVDNEGAVNMMVRRYAPNPGLALNTKLLNDGKANVSSNVPVEFNPRVGQQFAHLRPKWN
jgi:hypothetical protein